MFVQPKEFRLNVIVIVVIIIIIISITAKEARGYGFQLGLVYLRRVVVVRQHGHGRRFSTELTHRRPPTSGAGATKKVLELRTAGEHGEVGCTGGDMMAVMIFWCPRSSTTIHHTSCTTNIYTCKYRDIYIYI